MLMEMLNSLSNCQNSVPPPNREYLDKICEYSKQFKPITHYQQNHEYGGKIKVYQVTDGLIATFDLLKRGGLYVMDSYGEEGAESPFHIHSEEQESFFVCDGELLVTCETESGFDRKTLLRGDNITIPMRIPHRVEIKQEAWFIVILIKE